MQPAPTPLPPTPDATPPTAVPQAVVKPQSGSAGRFYRPGLDILRFYAFCIVFIHHALPERAAEYTASGWPAFAADWFSAAVRAGGLGVDLFFVLSSYLITELLIREHNRFGRINVPAFYARRALRIWPLYYAFVLASFAISPLIFHESLEPKLKLALLAFQWNWAQALHGIHGTMTAHLWSISIEEQFYLVWPLLIALIGIKRMPQALLILWLCAAAMRYKLLIDGAPREAMWLNTLARLDPILCGGALALFLKGRIPRLSSRQGIGIGAAGLLILIAVSRYARPFGPSALVFYPLVALATTALILPFLTAALATPSSLTRTLIYLGRISYGLYVFHLPSLWLAANMAPASPLFAQVAVRSVLGLLFTLIFAAASYELYEKHFLRLKERFTFVPSRPV